jgi:myo-inositol-1(or 4)-monophosphatase
MNTGNNVVWVIDPVDGTGEYIDAQLADSDRTSCVGIAMFKGGVLRLSVVHNPFRNELFVADRALGTASLNGERLDLTRLAHEELGRGAAYDYCYWDGAPIDARFFEAVIGVSPLGSYSAINQACDVARGKSAFAIFPGNTIHDIAPGALLVELAGGVVSDTRGMPLQWDNLGAGAVYAVNPNILASVIRFLTATTS